MLVTQSTLPHVSQLDCALGAGIHEPITTSRMEFRRSDDLCELLHVRRLYIDDVEALVLDVEIPEVNAQVVAADERLPITVDRDAVDMVRMGVSVRSSWNRSYNCIMVGEAW